MQLIRKSNLIQYLKEDETNQWKECLICSFIPAFYHKKIEIEYVSKIKDGLNCHIKCEEKEYQIEIMLEVDQKDMIPLEDEFHYRILLLCDDMISSHSPIESTKIGVYYHLNQIATICDGKSIEELNAMERMIQIMCAKDWKMAKEYLYDQTWLFPVVELKKKILVTV